MLHSLYNYFLTHKKNRQRNSLHKWLHWQLYKFLKSQLVEHYKNLATSNLRVDASSNIVVSLTSFPARIDVVHLAIRSVLNQTKKPKQVVLWLANEQFPLGEQGLPNKLLELKPLGLKIDFCEDIKAHKKYFFSFQEYSENLIVTVDDDIIYPRNFLEVLLDTHQKYPNCVVANRVRYMEVGADGFKPYREWKINKVDGDNPSKRIFSTGAGGVLYQPRFFQNSFYDIEGIKKTNCRNDDIWLKSGQLANNVSVAFTNFYVRQFIEIPDSQKESLFSSNVFEADNDRQMDEIFKYFGITNKAFD
ncbi:hypothetical protein [Winogradskyella psychrotolerans]|uniref:hypothetical protein n=1 Tax=Winogradskyella psychrotolerans TaxID=1344585 RepID=UPI001C066E87|nr:hypothetical protein [Winogradskyella psychrotolerans]MBU2929552.1 hypothetical protein [Winogradskyella psychrotolerans]